MSGEKKLAVVFRGPPATGKSTIARRLLKRLGRHSCECIVLDKGWGPGEFRFNSRERYRDLQIEEVTDQRIVFLELGCAEPIYRAGNGKYVLDLLPGASLNPKEWARILKGQGRLVHSFFLWADWATLEQRILKDSDRSLSLEFQKTVHSLYSRPDFSEHFAYHAGIEEDRLTSSSPDEIELTILKRLSSLGFELTPLDKIEELLPNSSKTEKDRVRQQRRD